MSDWKDSTPIIQSDENNLISYDSINTDRSKRGSDGDSNILPHPNQIVTRRHFLVWPAAFIFVTAYNMTFNSFSQYIYIKLQNENFPGIHVNKTTAFCEVNTSSVNYLIQEDVQQKAALWGIYLYLAGGLTAILSNFVLGSCTDRYGRKFLFILPCIGTILRTLLTIVGMHFDFPLYYYIPGYFLEGCTGQIFNIFQISYIYVADITTPGKQRSIGIVVIEIAIGLGSAVPALAVGYILALTDSFMIPFYISIGLLVISMILMLMLPETYPKEIRDKRKYSSSLENMKDAVDLFFGETNKGRRWMYVITLAAFIFTCYDVYGRVSMEGLYLLNYPFCWGPTKLGIFGTLRIVFQQLIGMGMVKGLQACMNDEMIAILGCISYGASFFLEAFSYNDTMMYIVTIVGACGLLTIPMIRSIMSQMTSPQKQGAVFASISAAESSINLVGAITSNSVYLATVKMQRGFTFLMFAAFNVISMLLLIFFLLGSRRSKHSVLYQVPEVEDKYNYHDNQTINPTDEDRNR